jgi:hypothetical protein
MLRHWGRLSCVCRRCRVPKCGKKIIKQCVFIALLFVIPPSVSFECGEINIPGCVS